MSVAPFPYGEAGMWTVKVQDEGGRERLFACGTIDQVLDRLDALPQQHLAVTRVKDPAGQEWSAMKFRAKFGS